MSLGLDRGAWRVLGPKTTAGGTRVPPLGAGRIAPGRGARQRARGGRGGHMLGGAPRRTGVGVPTGAAEGQVAWVQGAGAGRDVASAGEGVAWAPWALRGGRRVCISPPPHRPGRARLRPRACGEVPERSNGSVSKTEVRATVPWVRIPPSPPVQFRIDLSPDVSDAVRRKFPAVSSTRLLTGESAAGRKSSLRRPILSEAVDLGDLVRFSETQEIRGFQRAPDFGGFEPSSPRKRTSVANSLRGAVGRYRNARGVRVMQAACPGSLGRRPLLRAG